MTGIIYKIKEFTKLSIVRIFNLLKINKNKIFIFSYYGSQYGCSPKYISEYIVKNYPNKFDIVWAFNDINSNENVQGIRKVKTMTLRYFFELCTSKIIITNYRTTDLFIKRKNQYYIQTWHSSLRLKQIEKDTEESLPDNYVSMAKEDSKKIDLLLSGCKFSTEIFKRAFWYDGEIFEHGTPRNDIFFRDNEDLAVKLKDKFKINKETKIVLYAPTFRKDNGVDIYNISYEKILEELKYKFKGEWIFLVKLHPHLISKSKELVYGKNVLDVTSYDDIQELLSVPDVLISDYSSLMFDFSLSNKPCFLYVPDLEEYTSRDRELYFDINELPFTSAKSNEELLNKIEEFNEEEYRGNIEKFSIGVGSFEKGNCSEELVRHLDGILFK